MRLPIILTIFRKELVETLRDRRTLFMMVGLPVLLYPMLLIAVSWFQVSQSEAIEERSSTIQVWGSAPASLLGSLRATPHLRVDAVPPPGDVRAGLEAGRLAVPPLVREEADGKAGQETGERAAGRPRARGAGALEAENPVLAAARGVIASRQADGVLVAWPGFADAVEHEALGQVSVYFDSVRLDSARARERVADALEDYRRGLVESRERALGLPAGFGRAVTVHSRDVATESRRTGDLLGSLLPFLLISMSLLGAFYPAIDLTAGEKERGTMQTLMCAPLGSSEIILGKFLAVWAMSLVATLANVGSLAATMARIIPGRTLVVPASAYALTFAMLAPVTFFIAAVFLAVAAFAKDFKDGQNFLTPVYTLLVLPAGLTMLPGVDLASWSAFVPVLNIAVLVKSLLRGEAAPQLVFLVMLSSVAYAALAVALAARVFQHEQVLLGGRESAWQILGLQRRHGGRPSPALAIAGFAAVLVLVFYGSLALEGRGILVTLLATEYGFFLLPTLAVVLGLGFSARRTLSLRWPKPRVLAGAVLVGASAWTIGAGPIIRLLPPPESLTRALEKLLLLDGREAPLWMLWLVIGVTPALCEELFFRGFVLAGLRRLGRWQAVLLAALMFGLAHASIYRLAPTAFLGILFGLMVWWSGSILPAILAHAVNNGLMATLASSRPAAGWLGLEGQQFVPWHTTAIGAVVLVVGLVLAGGPLRRRARAAPPQPGRTVG